MKCRRFPVLSVLVLMAAFSMLGLSAGAWSELGAQTRYATGLDFTPEQLKKASPGATAPAAVVEAGGQTDLPERVDMTARFPTPGNQGQIGSCAPWAVAYAAKSYLTHLDRGGDLTRPEHLFSPSFLYNLISQGEDRGSSFPVLFRMLMTRGVATKATMPYTTDLTVRPSQAALEEAQNYRIRSFRKLEPDQLDAIRSHLAAGRPVMFGMQMNQAFMNHRDASVFRDGRNPDLGSHAMVLAGYDDQRGAFRLINSWGTGWGDNGYAWIDYQVFTNLTRDAWVMDVLTNEIPATMRPPIAVNAGEGDSTEHVALSWLYPTDIDSGTDGGSGGGSNAGSRRFRVYRANLETRRFEAVGETASREYHDADALPGVEYLYAVSTVGREGESEMSEVAMGWRAEPDTAPGTVRNLEGRYLGQSAGIEITWNAVDGADYYEVLRLESNGYFYVIGATTNAAFVDTPSASNGSNEDYTVRAVNSHGESELAYPVTILVTDNAGPRDKPVRTSGDSVVRAGASTRVETGRGSLDYFDAQAIDAYFRRALEAEREAFRQYRDQERQDFDRSRQDEQDAFRRFRSR